MLLLKACALVLLIAVVSLGVSSCTSGGGTANISASLEQPTVAVLPFTFESSADRGHNSMRGFESHYFPARLIGTLRKTNGIKASYFSPIVTPAADLNVTGKIVKSNGHITSVAVKVTSADGRGLWSRTFTVKADLPDFRLGRDPAGRIWNEIATALVQTKQKPGQFALARVKGYTKGAGALTITDRSVAIANKGAEVERSQLLSVYTERLLMVGLSALPVNQHLAWQRLSAPLVLEKSAAQSMAAWNAVAGAVYTAAAATSVYAASQGVSNPQFAEQAGRGAIMAAGNVETALATIAEINKTLSHINWQASIYKNTPISVFIYDAVYSLQGLPADQLQQLHQKIREKLLETRGS